MKITISLIVFILFSVFAVPSFAQDFFVYPSEGQSNEQTEKDKFECYSWAKGQTNFDPMALPTASAPPPAEEPKQGGAGRGLFRGAAGGAIIGAIAGDAGAGAAIGAASGTMIGGARRSEQKQRQQAERQQWEQQQISEYTAGRNAYNRAYVACLEARGYSVR